MGTNYYAHLDACPTCGKGEELHIGKSSAGWRFSFRAHPDRHPPIVSWRDWEQALRTATIKDEYDAPVRFSDFLRLVWSKEHQPNCQTCHMEKHHPKGYLESDQDYHDADGHPFSPREFS